MNAITIKSIGDCTLAEITELWNVGFQQYLNEMTMSMSRMVVHLGESYIDPQLSVAAYIDGVPAGFVLIGLKEAGGKKTAWNGGTGVNPAFRGVGIAKRLLQEAVRRVRETGADSLALEVRTDNPGAIAAYKRVGFEQLHGLTIFRRSGAFDCVPFRRERSDRYLCVMGMAEAVRALPFYLHRSAWMTQWFNARGSQSLIVYDRTGEVVGYALFSRSVNDEGLLCGVALTHCEANPEREDGRDVVRFMLGEVYGPYDAPIERMAHYLRSTNVAAMEALAEAGFEKVFEEYLMVLGFGAQSGRTPQ